MIQFNCPHCSAVLKVPDEAAGKTGRCVKCGSSATAPTKEVTLDDLATALQPASASMPPQSDGIPTAPKTKACLFCGEQILAAATKCEHCHESLVSQTPPQPALPMAVDELSAMEAEQPEVPKAQKDVLGRAQASHNPGSVAGTPTATGVGISPPKSASTEGGEIALLVLAIFFFGFGGYRYVEGAYAETETVLQQAVAATWQLTGVLCIGVGCILLGIKMVVGRLSASV